MLKVNNRKTMNALVKSSFISNKMRNIFATIAIVLTTVLFTGLFTVSGSMIASMEESTMRQLGGNAHGSFKYLSIDQYDKLKKHPSIESISYSVVLGVGENPELAKRSTEIRYASSDKNAEGMFALPTTGRLPEKDNEVATDSIVLDQLGIKPEIGQSLTLIYSVSGKKIIKTFELVGFWEGDPLMRASQLWLNKSYVEAQLVGYKPIDAGDFIGKINADVNFKNSFQLEKKLKTVILETGFNLEDIKYGYNWAYTGNQGAIGIDTIVSGLVAILMIVFCGYLIIANVFTISIVKDISYYGLLKTIGTTGRQIKRIILKQALILCLFAVPIGLIAGYLVGLALVPTILSILNVDVVKTSSSSMIFILSAAFSIVTVFISIIKPARLASKISPIEAYRTSEGTDTTGKKTKKSGNVNVFAMAFCALARNKKRALLVTISLSLGLIILNATFSLSNSFDMDKYLSQMIESDFSVGDVSNFNVNIWYDRQETLNDAFFKVLKQQEGIEKIENVYFTEFTIPMESGFSNLPKQYKHFYKEDTSTLQDIEHSIQFEDLLVHVYGVDEGAFEHFTILEGEINREKLATGKYIVVSAFDDANKVHYYNIGDHVRLYDTNNVSHSYEVIAIAQIPYNLSVKHYHGITPEYFLPSDIFLNQVMEKTPMLSTIDVEDDAINKVQDFLNHYTKSIDSNLDFESKATLSAEYEGAQRTYRVVGITISLIVALVGIMNFANTMITSIISRKREFAVLQSVGMTNKQLKTMLVLESLLYIVLTLICTFTIGIAVSYYGLSNLTSESMYMTLYFTVAPTIICLPILVIITLMVPILSQKIICKSSIIERLRMVE